ncbi:MAG TPA: polyketide cyclase, partial [Actinotalea sp.]|nr:polyketide cyclase [Actinotalea sp.]
QVVGVTPRYAPPRAYEVHAEEEFSVWDVGVEVAPDGPATRLRLTQVLHEKGSLPSVGPGWEWYLDRLVAVLTGADPDAIEWDAYQAALTEHYSV